MKGYKVQKYRCRLVKDGAATVVARKTIHNDNAAVEVFRAVLKGLPHEEVWLALTNARNDVTGLVRVSQGGLHGAGLRPSDVLRVVLVSGASGFVMAHNHPSGDSTPSQEDIVMTQAMVKACAVVGVTCLDHLVIVESGQWRSIRDSGVEFG